MKYADAFKYTNHKMIVKLFATNANQRTLGVLEKFMDRKHYLPEDVINGMIMYVLFTLDGKLPMYESYYRKVQEDWVTKKIVNTQVMLDYFKESLDIRESMQEQKRLKAEETQSAKRRLNEEYKKLIEKAPPIDEDMNHALDSIFKKV